jgi:glycosyltransferase involved in cell wall biosynthesis
VLGRQAEVIHPPVDVGRYRRLVNTLDRENVVTVISRFAREKNLDLIPHIAKNVNGKFIVIGSSNRDSGSIIAHLKEEIRRFGVENKVILWPNASHADKINALSRSKVFLHLRNFEPFGIAIVEAMAGGCIPITPDSGGPKEFVPARWRYRKVQDVPEKIHEAFTSWSKVEAEALSKITLRFDAIHFQRKIVETIQMIV